MKHGNPPFPAGLNDADDESYGFAMLIGFSGDGDIDGWNDPQVTFDGWDEGPR